MAALRGALAVVPALWRARCRSVEAPARTMASQRIEERLPQRARPSRRSGIRPRPRAPETLRTILRDDPQGVDKVIGPLERLRTRYPRREAMHKALAYCREHRHRIRYADLRARNLPIGSGVMEAACKTLVR